MKHMLIFTFIITFGNTFVNAQNDGDDISFGKYRIIKSEILKENRTLLIHLPENYERSEQEYPVVYMLYGNHTFTYFAEVISVLEKYGSDGQIPPMILVAINNTDRYRDLLPLNRDGTKTGIDNFLNFFKSELFPYIERNYRTKEFRVLLGPQAGANFAMYTLLKDPDVFDAFIINNPYRWSSGRDVLVQMADEFLEKNDSCKKFMFITHDDSDIYEIKGNEYIDNLVQKVKRNKLKDFILLTNHLPESKDFITPIGFKKGIRTYFKNYGFPEDSFVENLNDIKLYYKERSKEYGFIVDIPGHVLTMQSDKLAAKGNVKECREILEYMIEIKSQPENAYWRLADMSYRSGELESAETYLRKMLELIGSDAGLVKSRYDKIVKMINESAAYDLDKELKGSGLNKTKKKYQSLNSNKEKYFDESELNALGYRYLNQNKIKEALFIFQINVEQFPKSSKVYIAYAEALLKGGKKEYAIENYQRSLEIDPSNEKLKKQLQKLK